MKQHLLRLSFLSLAISVVGTAVAQTDLPYIFTARPKYTFSAALKVKTGGAQVKFGNLGTVPYEAVQYQLSASGTVTPTGNYAFHDGQIQADASTRRPEEGSGQIESGYTVILPGGRYALYGQKLVNDSEGRAPNTDGYVTTLGLDNSPGGLLANNLSYKDGQTRYWSYQDNSQAADGYVNFHAYSAESSGAVAQAESGKSGGFEIQLSRELGSLDRKGSSWGVSLSFGVTDINAKSSGVVHSNLITETGRFKLLGSAPGAPYQAPSTGDLLVFNADGTPYMVPVLASDGVTVQKNPDGTDAMIQKTVTNGLETTTPLASTGDITRTTTANGADVDGRWQVKGAYYMLRMGPSFRYQFTPRVSVSGGVGLATAYVGSVYSTTETLIFPNGAPILETTSGVLSAPSIQGELRKRDLMLGYYGELNLEYWITFRTGFFVGLVYEHIGSYNQDLGGRTASIDVGSGTAFRVGVTTRF